MNYETTLEKGILEYAAYASAHPQTRSNGQTKIPGFIDAHVWGMAMQLNDKELIIASVIDERGAVCITEICEPGSKRLKEIEAQVEEEAAEEKQKQKTAVDQAKSKKKWWKFGKA